MVVFIVVVSGMNAFRSLVVYFKL